MLKRFILIFAICCGLSFPAFALTSSERKAIAKIQTYVRQGQVEYKAASDAAAQADARAADADARAQASDQHASETDANIVIVQKEIKKEHDTAVALQKENDKMKPIYDKVRGPWWAPGLGAIIYGVGRLARFALILAGIGVVIAILLVIFVPAVIPFLEVAGRAILAFFELIGAALSRALRSLGGLLKKAPPPAAAPPPPPAAALTPGQTGPTGPTA